MAEIITLAQFEAKAKKFNKSGLKRSYTSIPNRLSEYGIIKPLGATNKILLEVLVDKEFAEELINLFKSNGFNTYGNNYYFYDCLINEYDSCNKQVYKNVNPDAVEAIRKDVEEFKAKTNAYEETENDDAKFYLLPYNEDIESLFEFVEVYKEKIKTFAIEKDITIMLKPITFTNQISGFIGFNFFDADAKDQNVVVDYAPSITINVDFNNFLSVYNAALLLKSIGENEDELKEVNVLLLTENK